MINTAKRIFSKGENKTFITRHGTGILSRTGTNMINATNRIFSKTNLKQIRNRHVYRIIKSNQYQNDQRNQAHLLETKTKHFHNSTRVPKYEAKPVPK